MRLSSQIASSIVKEINQVIDENINIMDAKGIITASSDPQRIGNFLEGAHTVVEHNLDQLIIKSEDEYKGSKPGINIPIRFREETVGVIGMTGSSEAVLRQGNIIRKMSEILLLDKYYRDQKTLEEKVRLRFLNDWLMGEVKIFSDPFIQRGLSFGIDIRVPRRIILFSVLPLDDEQNFQSISLESTVQEKMMRWAQRTGEVITYTAGSYVLMAVTNRSEDDMEKFCLNVKNIMESEFKVLIIAGFDEAHEDPREISLAHQQALKSLKTALRSKEPPIRSYQSINMEIFLGEISDHSKKEYLHRIFKGLDQSEINQRLQILEVYYDEEGSLQRTAERLFIHRNTLQYRLKKIFEETGYNPRSIKFSSLFYIAIHFYRDLYSRQLI